jgi:hypothetical protein
VKAEVGGGYRLTLGPYEEPTLLAQLGANASSDRWAGRVVVQFPMITVDDAPYYITASLRPEQARQLARQLNRTAAILDPPKKRVPRG